MNKEKILNEIEKIEKEIQLKIQKYSYFQKKYHGDSSYSKKIEYDIDILECRQNKLKKMLEGMK